MNYFINYLILIIAIGLTGLYVVSFIINLIRTNQVKKELYNNPASVTGTITKIMEHKKKVYVRVQFVSPTNKMKFENVFEYFKDEFNDRGKVGDEILITYPDIEKLKRVYAFPIFLDQDKIKMPLGPTVTDLLLVGFSIYVLISIIISMVENKAFTTNISVTQVHNPVMIVLYAVMHLLLISYAIDRLINAPQDDNQKYLEFYGINGTAQVKTFKFAGSKNAKGFKESQMEIEYYNEIGEKIKARCASYYYSETQEEFINILYDPRNYKNVVYVKTSPKEKKKKEK